MWWVAPRALGGGGGAAPDACAPPRPSLPSPCQPGPVHLWRWWSGVGVQWIKCNAWRGTCGGWHPGPSAAAGRRRGAAPDACAPPRPSLPSPCQPGPVHLWRWWSGVGVQWIKCNAWRGTCGGWHPGPSAAAAPRPTRVPRRGPRCRAHASPGLCTSGGGGVGVGVQWIKCNAWRGTCGGWHPGPSAAAGRRRGAAPDACAPPRPSLPSPCQPGPVHLWRWWSGVGVQWIKCNAWRGTCGGWHPGPSAAAAPRPTRVPRRGPRCRAHASPGLCTSGGGGVGVGVQWIKCNAWRGTCGGWHPGPSAAAGRRRGAAADACAPPRASLPSPCPPGCVHLFFFFWGGGGGGGGALHVCPCGDRVTPGEY